MSKAIEAAIEWLLKKTSEAEGVERNVIRVLELLRVTPV